MKKITGEMQKHNFEQEALGELNRMLDEEMAKPHKMRDYAKIEEISRACAAVMGDAEQEKEAMQQGYETLTAALHKPRIRMTGRIKAAAVLASAAAVLVGANIFTVTAYNMNLFSALVKITNGGFALNPQPQETAELPTTAEDPYGIKAECAKYGITDVLAPTYLPESFTLGILNQETIEDHLNSIDFTFYDADGNLIQILYNQWDNETLHGNTPCDDYNLTETEIDGNPAIISKEDGQYVLVFRNDTNLETQIWMDGVDYEECDKIVASLDN